MKPLFAAAGHPSETELFEDWQRSARAEPMKHARHIAGCDECRGTLDNHTNLRAAVTAALHIPAEGHLTEEQIGAFVEHRMKPLERKKATEHVVECKDCLDAVVSVREAVHFPEPQSEAAASVFGNAWMKPLASFGLGIAATLVVISMTRLPTGDFGVTVGGHKGQSENTQAYSELLGRIHPRSPAEFELAISLLKAVTDANPEDAVAKARLDELKSLYEKTRQSE